MAVGAGLGRLCLELTNLGVEVQGNEFSYYMLLASSFILNSTSRANQWTVFPWLHSNCNQKTNADQLRGVSRKYISGNNEVLELQKCVQRWYADVAHVGTCQDMLSCVNRN